MQWQQHQTAAVTMYPDALQAAVNQLIAKVHGHETISGFRPAKLYTGRH